jgi:hypothetical protein
MVMKNWKRTLPVIATVVVATLAALVVVVLVTRGEGGTPAAQAATQGGRATIEAEPSRAEPTPSATPAPSPSASSSKASAPAEETSGDAPDTATTAAPATKVPASTAPTPSAATTTVSVTLAYHGWSWVDDVAQVGGVVAGAKKPDGTCTLTMTSDGRSVTGTSAATADEKGGVVCAAVSVPGAELSPGMWQAVLSYSAPGQQGSSPAVDIEVVK